MSHGGSVLLTQGGQEFLTFDTSDQRVPVSIFAFGESIHKALAQFSRQGGHARKSVDDLVELLMRHWDGKAYENQEESEAQFLRAREMLEAFYANPYPAAIERELGVEAFVSWERARRGILAVGKIDRACLLKDGTLEVVDYKCGKRKFTQQELMKDHQMAFYRTLAAEQFRSLAPQAIKVTFLYLDGPQAVSVEFDQQQFQDRWHLVEETARRIQARLRLSRAGVPLEEAFPLSRGSQCQSCPMREHCDGIEAMPGISLGA